MEDEQKIVSQIIQQVSVSINIGKKIDLSVTVKSEIVKSIANGMRTIKIERKCEEITVQHFKKLCAGF